MFEPFAFHDGIKGGALMSWLRWGNFSAFYLLIVVVFFVVAYFYFEKMSQARLEKAFGRKVASYLSQSVSVIRRRLKILIQAVALILLIVALARPQAGESQQEIKSEAKQYPGSCCHPGRPSKCC